MHLVLSTYAPPRPARSEVNASLADVALGVEGVTFADPYAESPSFEIDVDRRPGGPKRWSTTDDLRRH